MILQFIAGIAAVTVIGASASSSSDGACWQMISSAIDRNAHVSHVRFISYGERSTFSVDGQTSNVFNSKITYRDDGMAYIDDERWTYPTISSSLEPGPPLLGPYGDSRSKWLSLDTDSTAKLRVIAHVYAHPNESCRDAGSAIVDNRTVEHLLIGEENAARAGLREAWIDPATLDIARVVIRGPVRMLERNAPVDELANYVLEMQTVDGHSVLRRASWQYREKQNSQWADISGVYEFMNYRFSDVEPPGTFSAVTAAAQGSSQVPL